MLWGCSAEENPVAPLLDLAASTHPAWDTRASSLIPNLAQLPIGMVIIDDAPLPLDPGSERPDRFGSHGSD